MAKKNGLTSTHENNFRFIKKIGEEQWEITMFYIHCFDCGRLLSTTGVIQKICPCKKGQPENIPYSYRVKFSEETPQISAEEEINKISELFTKHLN